MAKAFKWHPIFLALLHFVASQNSNFWPFLVIFLVKMKRQKFFHNFFLLSITQAFKWHKKFWDPSLFVTPEKFNFWPCFAFFVLYKLFFQLFLTQQGISFQVKKIFFRSDNLSLFLHIHKMSFFSWKKQFWYFPITHWSYLLPKYWVKLQQVSTLSFSRLSKPSFSFLSFWCYIKGQRTDLLFLQKVKQNCHVPLFGTALEKSWCTKIASRIRSDPPAWLAGALYCDVFLIIT